MKIVKRTAQFLASGTMLLVTMDALPQPTMEEAVTVSERGEYAPAHGGYRLAAERGDAFAQFHLSLKYEYGDRVPQDMAEAVRWYRLAAEQGYAAAQNNLGRAYGVGRGVVKDDAEAARWYRLAAEQGHSSAQSELALMYKTGVVVPEGAAEAVR